MKNALIAELEWRGLLADCTDIEALSARMDQGPIALYCGFDPSGDSLHIGNLVGQIMLRRFQAAGHHPIALAGGATGMIGDPSGKSAERNLLSAEQLAHNVACISTQLERLLDFQSTTNPARLVNNADWTAPLSFLDFLRDVGKHFSLTAMLAKDSVKSRLGSESGISYTEFSYQLLQAYDFYHLRDAHNCELQVGGSDQWGNITAGSDFTRRKLGATVWGWTFPLITKADGSKFGKTETGTVWLDPRRTSPYKFYQFFLNAEDAKVVDYLKIFTFLSKAQIEEIGAATVADPGARVAQKALAGEVTTLVHGAQAVAAATQASSILFGADIGDADVATFEALRGEVPTVELAPGALTDANLVDVLVQSGLCASKGAARRDIAGGGIYLNNKRCADAEQTLVASDVLFDRYVLLRKGKKSYVLLVVG